jgi:hypothetical protein
MFGLVVMEGMTLSGHLSNIDEMSHFIVLYCFSSLTRF